MRTVKGIVVSTSEPPVNNVGWLKSLSNGTFMLFFFGDKGWTPISIGIIRRIEIPIYTGGSRYNN